MVTQTRHTPRGLYPLQSELITKAATLTRPSSRRQTLSLSIPTNSTGTSCKQLATTCAPRSVQTLWQSFKAKAPTEESPPPSLQHRFDGLLEDAANAFQSDAIPCPLAAALVASRGVTETSGGVAGIDIYPDLTLANIEAVEGVFDTAIGVNVENDQVCRFVRATTAV